jgi:hypothetical protein
LAPLRNERARRLWAAAESIAIGYGGDAPVSSETGSRARPSGTGAGRPTVEGATRLTAALARLVDPLARGDPMPALRWTCKSRAQLTAALTADDWRVSASAVARLLHALGCRPIAAEDREGQPHLDRNAQFAHVNATAATFLSRTSRSFRSTRRRN